MDLHKSTADRIRPILQAMDRTIDTLRRSRTNVVPTPAPISPAPSASKPTPTTAPVAPAAMAPESSPRLKARPKRLDSPFMNSFGQPPYRSQAS
jgi:hypothetical protein